MKLRLKDFLPSLLITIVLLAVLEVVATTLLPVVGIQKYRLPFNILIVLYVGFKLETPYLALIILVIQYFYSFFSIEGWAMGTFAGVIVCMIISYLKDLIHFSSVVMTIFVTQVFQTIWFIVVAALIYIQVGEWDYITDKLWRFFPESIVVSLIAPLVFSFLDRIWKVRGEQGSLGDDS